MTNTARFRRAAAVFFALCLLLCIPGFAHADEAVVSYSSENLNKAAKEYGVPLEEVLPVTSNTIEATLSGAGANATPDSPAIVYAKAGSYTVSQLVVPANVVLVADENAKFIGADKKEMIIVRGSIYGGSYVQKSSANAIMCYKQNYVGSNGRVEYVNVTGNVGGNAGVFAYACDNVTVVGCTVSGGMNGIRISEASYAPVISGNTVSNCGSGAAGSGIDIMLSDVGIISNNTVTGCRGHGISTGTTATAKAHNWINIGQISNNIVKNNNKQGLYVEGNTHISNLIGNTFTGNGTGVAMRSNVHSYGNYSTKHFDTWVKNVKSNKFVSNKGSNISVIGKMAKFYLVSGNQLNTSQTGCGLSVAEGAAVAVTGTNTFNGNKTSGVIVQSKGKLTMKGANCQFNSNTRSGVSVDHGTVIIAGNGSTFSKNKQHGLSLTAGGVVKITAKNVKIVSNHNDVNATGSGASLTCTGTGVTIASNRNHGISLNSKAKAVLKNTKFSKNKRWCVYVGKGCSCKYSKTNIPKGKGGLFKAK